MLSVLHRYDQESQHMKLQTLPGRPTKVKWKIIVHYSIDIFLFCMTISVCGQADHLFILCHCPLKYKL